MALRTRLAVAVVFCALVAFLALNPLFFSTGQRDTLGAGASAQQTSSLSRELARQREMLVGVGAAVGRLEDRRNPGVRKEEVEHSNANKIEAELRRLSEAIGRLERRQGNPSSAQIGEDANEAVGTKKGKFDHLPPVLVRQRPASDGTECSLFRASRGHWVDNVTGAVQPFHTPTSDTTMSPWSEKPIHTQLRFRPGCDGFNLTVLSKPAAQECFRGRKIMIFGDSQGLWLMRQFLPLFEPCRAIRSGTKCNEGEHYFGFKPHPTLKGECKKCGGCVSLLWECVNGVTLEHLALERIDDVQMPCTEFNTTQECVIENYMVKNPPDAVLFNAGLHIAGNENMTRLATTYMPRLRWYFQTMRSRFPLAALVWIQTSHHLLVEEEVKVMQLVKWSEKVGVQNAFPMIDAHRISAPRFDLYTDPVHLHGDNLSYYKLLRDLFFSWYCGGLTR
jgi:hypothetical protein